LYHFFEVFVCKFTALLATEIDLVKKGMPYKWRDNDETSTNTGIL